LATDDLPMNHGIRAAQVRLVGGDGEQAGVVPLREALRRAQEDGLDLVQIAGGDVPVCRIVDGGRWLYERKRQERENARRQRANAIEVKEVQLRPVTDDGDLHVKSGRARQFLLDGDKVRIVVKFRGRERAHKDIGRALLDRFLSEVGAHKVEGALSDGGGSMTMLIAPLKTKAELARERAA